MNSFIGKNWVFLSALTSAIAIGLMTLLSRTCINLIWMNAAAISLAFHKPGLRLLIALIIFGIYLVLIYDVLLRIHQLIRKIIEQADF